MYFYLLMNKDFIYLFIFTMIRVISAHWSWSGSSQRNAPWEKAAYENTKSILGDSGADSGGQGKCKRAGKKWREEIHQFTLSLSPTICPWVSKDVQNEDILVNANRPQSFINLLDLAIKAALCSLYAMF